MRLIIKHLVLLLLGFGLLWAVLSTIPWVRILHIKENTKASEEKIGLLLWEQISHSETVLKGSGVTQPMDDFLSRLCSENGLEKSSFHVHVIENSEINAFAMPGGYIGVDLPKVNPNIRFIECPFTGERLAAIPAHRPDVAVIHALRADKAGNVLLEGIVGVQKEAVLASKRAVVTVEEVVEDFGPRNANAVILPSWTVSAIAIVPGGAFPSYAHGYYKRNNKFYIDWDEISRERDTFLRWMDENVMSKGPEAFARYAGK